MTIHLVPGRRYGYRTLLREIARQLNIPITKAHEYINYLIDTEQVEVSSWRGRRVYIPKSAELTVFVYRVQVAESWYTRKKTKGTPNPFADFRVYVYTMRPEKYPESMLASILEDYRDRFFTSIKAAMQKENIVYSSMSALEIEKIDEDEMTIEGLGFVEMDHIYFYGAVYKEGAGIEYFADVTAGEEPYRV